MPAPRIEPEFQTRKSYGVIVEQARHSVEVCLGSLRKLFSPRAIGDVLGPRGARWPSREGGSWASILRRDPERPTRFALTAFGLDRRLALIDSNEVVDRAVDAERGLDKLGRFPAGSFAPYAVVQKLNDFFGNKLGIILR